jgi:hypothetical protein
MNGLRNLIVANVIAWGSVGLIVDQARSDLAVSTGVQIQARADFESPLAPLGSWVETGAYGRCFRPAGIAADWRPYCDGQWVWTDYGWYWESNEPWAWACYHYGTWEDDPVLGWIWVPDIEWAPAWVEWRVGGGYVGWTPCAPRGVTVAPALFVFVDVNHFHDPVRSSSVVRNNAAILQQSTPLTAGNQRQTLNIGGRVQNVVVNEGPGVAAVEKATGRKVDVVPLQEVIRQPPGPSDPKSGAGGDGDPAKNGKPADLPQNGSIQTPVQSQVPANNPVHPVNPSPGAAQPPPRREEPRSTPPPAQQNPASPRRDKDQGWSPRKVENGRMYA